MMRLAAILAVCTLVLLAPTRAQLSPNIQELMENPVYRPLVDKVCAPPVAVAVAATAPAPPAAATASPLSRLSVRLTTVSHPACSLAFIRRPTCRLLLPASVAGHLRALLPVRPQPDRVQG